MPRFVFWIAMSLTAFAAPVEAEPAGPATYALVVGSNRPGDGQRSLRWADRDAERVARVLEELGGATPGRVSLLLDPGRSELLAALDVQAERLAEHGRRDEQAVFVFYYSGHARARALNLGDEELELAALRERLEGLGATVTLAVLDACQSGAISQVKGVEPAADFSHNSVADLSFTGMAVMASSTGAELSQESADLQGSYFTHHLVTGLRGAADEDDDGRVTLSEAYRYAYRRTLVATAATAVGRQHVTLETALRGKGEVVLTWPRASSARLVFPGPLAGEVLVHRTDSQAVVAEVHKVEGSALSLALPPGDYTALVRQDETLFRCALALADGRPTALFLAGCDEVVEQAAAVKGEGRAEPPDAPLETWGLEVGGGLLLDRRGPYVRTLESFGFDESTGLFERLEDLLYDFSVTWTFHRHLALVATYGNLDSGEYDRQIEEMSGDFRDQCFKWKSWRLGLALRAGWLLANGWLVPYLQAGGGLAFAKTRFVDGGVTDGEDHTGYYLNAALGLQLMPTIKWWRYVGLYAQAEVLYAPVIDNLAGDTHDVGGFAFVFGARGAF